MKSLIVFFVFFSSYTLLYCQSNADYYYNNAVTYMNAKNFQDAITNFNKALELYPDSLYEQISLTYWDLNFCYSNLKEYSKAISACYSWINKGGWYLGNAYHWLGYNFFSKGEFASAINAYGNAIQNLYSVKDGTSVNLTDVYRDIKNAT